MNILEILGQSNEKIRGQRLILRDDHYEFSELQNILEKSARKKVIINLLDSGRFDHQELEILGEFPFSFYTSDAIRPDFSSLTILAEILNKKKRPVYLKIENNINNQQIVYNSFDFFTSIFISSRERPVDLDWLAAFSETVAAKGTTIVYYHHQNLEEKLAEVSQKSVWTHVSNRTFSEDQEIMVVDLIKKIRKKNSRLVVHIERAQSARFIKLLNDSGAFLIFSLPPVETGSDLYRLEKRWRKKELPEIAFYLYPDIMA